MSVGVRVAGNVRVGLAAFLGMGATVLPNVQIGERAVVGAGAVVLKDVPPHAVVHGVPARAQLRSTNRGHQI